MFCQYNCQIWITVLLGEGQVAPLQLSDWIAVLIDEVSLRQIGAPLVDENCALPVQPSDMITVLLVMVRLRHYSCHVGPLMANNQHHIRAEHTHEQINNTTPLSTSGPIFVHNPRGPFRHDTQSHQKLSITPLQIMKVLAHKQRGPSRHDTKSHQKLSITPSDNESPQIV